MCNAWPHEHWPVCARLISSNNSNDASSSTSSFLLASSSSYPQHKVDNNSKQQRNSQHRRAKTVVKSTLSSHANALCAPVECYESVDHRHQSNECEESSADLSDAVAEVEEADGKAAEDDGEVEPWEEGALVGEEDFGLNAGREGDALAWCWYRQL
jgi:hypothetical protein